MHNQKPPHPDQWYLEQDYLFSGLFYKAIDKDKYEQPCRMVLDIKHKKCKKRDPDLMVIMMNPGGSFPLYEKIDCNKAKKGLTKEEKYAKLVSISIAEFVPTYPDDTQWKVIEFMQLENLKDGSRKMKYEYVRVLNLTDVCNTESNTLKAKDRNYSIFMDTTLQGIDANFGKNIPVLFAWGCTPILNPISKNVIENLFKNYKGTIFGFPQASNSFNYLHPKARKTDTLANGNVETWIEGVKPICEETLLLEIKNKCKENNLEN